MVGLKTRIMIICCSAASFIAAAPSVNFKDLRTHFNTFVAQAQNGALSQAERINALDEARGIINQLLALDRGRYNLPCFEGFGFNGVAVNASCYGRITESLAGISRALEAYRTTIVPQVAAMPVGPSDEVVMAIVNRWQDAVRQRDEHIRRLEQEVRRL